MCDEVAGTMQETLVRHHDEATDDDLMIPPFQPHPLVGGPHAQTVVGRYLGGDGKRLAATPHEIALPDGDRLVVLESIPPSWQGSAPTALLVHGLAGCADAAYIVRVGRRLLRQGIRVVRMNLRCSGAGFGLARGIYHAGRSDDLREVITWLHERESRSPIGLVGFSLGANLALKAAVEAAEAPVAGLDCVLAANPPIDLVASAVRLKRLVNRLYTWNFARWLRGMVARLHERFPELGHPRLEGVNTLYDFDDRYTAPRNGFASADDYYERCSLVGSLARVRLPGLIVHALDDPFIAAEPFLRVMRPPSLCLELVPHGGHMGYLSRQSWQGDHRWLDARLSMWLASRWRMTLPRSST
jgi:predicted alpha/beta-fold hydrolase